MFVALSGPLLYFAPVKGTHANVGISVKYSVADKGRFKERSQTLVQFAIPADHPAYAVLSQVESGAIVEVQAGALFLTTFTRKSGEEVTAVELRRVRQVSLLAVSTLMEKVGATGGEAEVEVPDTPADLIDQTVDQDTPF